MFLTGKDGKISVVRIGTLIAVAGVLFFIVAAAIFYFDQASRRRPLQIDVYPGAREMNSNVLSRTSLRLFYEVSDATPSEIAAYYDAKLAEFQRGVSEEMRVSCVRNPAEGNFPDYVPGEGLLPFEHRCMFDRSGFNTIQRTQVRIYPNITEDNETDGVMIVYDQEWSR